MKHESITFTPGPTPNTVRAADGRVLTAPEGWILLPPGDAALTRRVKAAGDHWVVQEKKGRKVFSRGVWAPAATIDRIRAELEAERSTEGFAKKKEADARRRDKAQAEYVEDFLGAVVAFLAFHPNHADLADRLATSRHRSCHAGRQRHGGQDEAHPGRAAGRGCRDRLDAPPDDRLRWHGDPTGQGQAAGGSTNAGPAIPGIAGAVSAGRSRRGSVSFEDGAGGQRRRNCAVILEMAILTFLMAK